jgi:hypothetical protein
MKGTNHLHSRKRKHKRLSIVVSASVLACVLGFVIPVFSVFSLSDVYAEEPTILYAADYGAVADGETNSAAGIQAAVNAANKLNKPVEIRLDEGEYRLHAMNPEYAAVVLKKVKNLTIKGVVGKTIFTIENPSIGTFYLEDCENITIQNITVDYDPLPFTQGTVVATDKTTATLDIDIDEGYVLPNESFFDVAQLRVAVRKNPAGDETSFGDYSFQAKNAIHVSGRIYRINASATDQFGRAYSAAQAALDGSNMKPGDRVYYIALRFNQAAVNAWRCKNVAVSDLTIYAGPSIATMWVLNDTVHINRMNIAIKPGTNRLIANNACGVHALGTRGGILMENCDISDNADDAVNIHSRSGIITEVISSTRIRVNNRGTTEYRSGDSIQIMRKGQILGTALVLSVQTEGNYQTVKFDTPVTGINAGTKFSDSDSVINLSACGQGSVFRNNVFGYSAGRSLLISAHDVLIENNTFRNLRGWAIALSYDANYGEGPAGYDVTIRGNTFYGVGTAIEATIYMCSITPWSGGPIQGVRPIKNILIENNIFDNPRNTIIYANGVDGMKIEDNTSLTREKETDPNQQTKPFPLILLENSEGVQISNLTVTDPNPQLNSAVLIKSTVKPGIAGVTTKNIVMHTVPFYKAVTDERYTPTSPSPPVSNFHSEESSSLSVASGLSGASKPHSSTIQSSFPASEPVSSIATNSENSEDISTSVESAFFNSDASHEISSDPGERDPSSRGWVILFVLIVIAFSAGIAGFFCKFPK